MKIKYISVDTTSVCQCRYHERLGLAGQSTEYTTPLTEERRSKDTKWILIFMLITCSTRGLGQDLHLWSSLPLDNNKHKQFNHFRPVQLIVCIDKCLSIQRPVSSIPSNEASQTILLKKIFPQCLAVPSISFPILRYILRTELWNTLHHVHFYLIGVTRIERIILFGTLYPEFNNHNSESFGVKIL